MLVFERKVSGHLYGRIWSPSGGCYRVKCLGHADRAQGVAWAADQHAKLVRGEEALGSGRVTLALTCERYLEHHTPTKCATSQADDRRRVELWCRVLGPDKDPLATSSAEWSAFIHDRTSGAIDARGCAVELKARRVVRTRTVSADLEFLQLLLAWGTKWREGDRYLLRENVTRGYRVPVERNPRRPVATVERYQALRAKCDQVHPFLGPILDLADCTGHRLSAVRSLQYDDLLLSAGPHGMVRWRAETSKNGEESVTAVDARTRGVLDGILTERPGIGPAPLFPSPDDPRKPIDRFLLDRLLRKAEGLAELKHLPGTAFHGFRRKWASEMQYEPATVVATLGGWKNVAVMQRAYQHTNAEMMVDVLSRRREYREVSK